MIYSIRQLKGRRRVSKVPEIERTVKVRQFRGGVYPRLILDSPSVFARPSLPSVIARPVPSEARELAEAISVGDGRTPLSMTI
jgi:hypothetical protein